MKRHAFILGANDVEMGYIRTLLKSSPLNIEIYQATVNGEPVNSSNAYRVELDCVPCDSPNTVTLVECGFEEEYDEDYLIDHHHEGDPGWGVGPERFLEGSSLGQVIQHLHHLGDNLKWLGDLVPNLDTYGSKVPLGDFFLLPDGRKWALVIDGYDAIVIPERYVLAAAADHCLAHSYAGKCPGVSRMGMTNFRVDLLTSMNVGANHSYIRNKIADYRDWLAITPMMEMGGFKVLDYRLEENNRELREACAQTDVPLLYQMTDRDTGESKLGLLSSNSELITHFIEVWGPENGLTNLYGCPTRGYCGGYTNV